MTESKKCSGCKVVKSREDFTIHRRNPDGLNCYCRDCSQSSRTASRLRRLDKEAAYARVNKERLSEQKRKRRRGPAGDRERAANLQRYHANKAQWSEWHSRWTRAHKESNRLYGSQRRAKLAIVVTIPFTVEQLAQRWDYYGNQCWVCHGKADANDHVKPISKGGAHMLCNVRPICTPCNSSKHDRWPLQEWLIPRLVGG
jgi:5-methylcytosine-specific restriction endonuclease McrA